MGCTPNEHRMTDRYLTKSNSSPLQAKAAMPEAAVAENLLRERRLLLRCARTRLALGERLANAYAARKAVRDGRLASPRQQSGIWPLGQLLNSNLANGPCDVL